MRRPLAVVVAAVLSALYSLGLLWFAGAGLTVLVRTGGWGDPNAAKGMVVVGSIGEVVDILGTATRQSDLIGAAVLAAAAVPIGLLITRSARSFAASRRR